jgi:hypothetical protein
MESFSVSARVKVDRLSGVQTLVSVDGSQASGFYLQYRAEDSGFAFVRLPADEPVPADGYLPSMTVPEAGRWYMVTGVYDAEEGTLTLYVDGRREAHTLAPPAWRARGSLVMGRGLHGGFTDFVAGSLDEVWTFAGALSPLQVADLYRSGTWRAVIDDDGDGFGVPFDCNDRDPGVYPNAVDVIGDGIDQDCFGGDGSAGSPLGGDDDAAPASRIRVGGSWLAGSRLTRVRWLRVRNVPELARMEVRCRGGGCPFRRYVLPVPNGGTVELRPLLRRSRLRVGTVLEIRVSGVVARFTMRAGRSPLRDQSQGSSGSRLG